MHSRPQVRQLSPSYSVGSGDARPCGVSAAETFAFGLEQDATAVRAALVMPWSTGQAKGQINKLKLLKRQTYGRASFELLRHRVLLAA